MFKLYAAALVLGVCCTAFGGSIPVTYNLDLGNGTLNGNDLTSVAIFETDGTQSNLSFPFTLGGSGLQTLTHASDFQPTSSILVGLDLTTPNVGDNKVHLVFFTNDAFALAANGVLFSAVFPNTHHNDFISRLTAAESGDQTQTAWLTSFFSTGDGASARFATGGSSTAIEFTGGVLLTPEPVSFGLVGIGLSVLLFAPRLRSRSRSLSGR